ncbi:phosphate acyltransferase PlsX [Mesoaciditoga lauensis]|uniref:phosphate acyltransferase PlsX n=1 Tax=Mesoaciditoga lauensis TaxID=1495039 RepID=UPI0005635CC3|nr:phosphate acyltransferase PlsX [Mesoaciditoga lauensis]
MARIALDAFGSDNAPYEETQGALLFVKKTNHTVILVGDEEKLKTLVPEGTERVEIFHAPKRFGMSQKPTEILRMKDSSLAASAQLVKEGKADGFVSAGNTGAILVCGTFIVGRIKGVERPAIATTIPSVKGGTVLIDSGANASLKPQNYPQIAVMGLAYAKAVLGRKDPKCGLLNVGSEPEKGNDTVKEAYAFMKEKLGDAFVGNVEGRDICMGDVDVVVSDGFSGNIALKTLEGVGAFFSKSLKDSIKKSNIFQKIGALMMKGTFNSFKESFDYRKYGGAFLLGVNGTVVKAHGSSDEVAIYNALRVASQGVKNHILDRINEGI